MVKNDKITQDPAVINTSAYRSLPLIPVFMKIYTKYRGLDNNTLYNEKSY